MKQSIPKIIHQIWSGVEEPLPEHFRMLGETWKANHPTWEYVLWDNNKMNDFIQKIYPQYWNTYNSFKYNIQRWDSIRYLILNEIGGIYADFDTECLKPMNNLLKDKTCCFSLEPKEHAIALGVSTLINNAIMMSEANHSFMKKVVIKVFQEKNTMPYTHRNLEILDTTGPLMLTKLYETFGKEHNVHAIPAEYISPFTRQDTIDLFNNINITNLEGKLKKAFAVHYFFNTWT
ncbi:glycosyltransferase family 32 protein [Dysgonomonas sp. ZJ709]|uniref:glycosyltransferase family 32 protein n=1 Tax=Dysgonomonas sp. ZJ709 TaxID=2709797 RepID=UPI0013EB318F|nr:glycosyltransferase [Dysgonomonas sp. ZJ709]